MFVLGVLFLLVWGFIAAYIAAPKQARNVGFWLGVFFGPVGAILAGFLEGRPQCPRCGGRINPRAMTPYRVTLYPICQHCGFELPMPAPTQITESSTYDPSWAATLEESEMLLREAGVIKETQQDEEGAVGTSAG
jgi:uncharacterized membrane protein YeaQ/YmgE (transglycosylase-associated protein family)